MQLVAEKETDEPTEFRYGIPPDIFAEWRAAQKRIGLPQTQILHRLVRFLLSQNEVTQGMILGQLTPREDLLEFALKNSRKPRSPGVFNTLAATKKDR